MKQSKEVTGIWMRTVEGPKREAELLLEISGEWHKVRIFSGGIKVDPDYWPMSEIIEMSDSNFRKITA